MKYFRLIAAATLLLLSLSVFAQAGYYDEPEGFGEKEKRNEKRWFFGGNFWLSFGSYTYIDVEPLVGYRVIPRLAIAAGPVYTYAKSTEPIYRGYYGYNTYGGRTITRFTLIDNLGEYIPIGNLGIVAEAQYDVLSTYLLDSDIHYLSNNLLLGGAIKQSLGGSGSVYISVLWDVTQNYNSPYENPIISIGFGF